VARTHPYGDWPYQKGEFHNMISSKIVASAAAIAAAALGGQVAASAASAATVSTAHAAAYPAAFRSPRHDPVIRAVLTDSQRYTVQPGDTLSGIGQRYGISWQALYAANQPVIGSNPNLIFAGQVLTVSGGSQVPAQPEPSQPAVSDQAQPTQQTQPAQQSNVSQSSGQTGNSGGSAPFSFQQCVIQHESGGNAQVMNSSGHYGLYQFSQSSWDAAGGNPADFGHASAAEQSQVFQNAYAQWGTSPWAPYDGC
jgi:LysM repeat protein